MIKSLNSNAYKLAYEIKKISVYSPFAVVRFYSKIKSFFIHQNEKGYYIFDGNNKIYFDAVMNEHLRVNGVKGISNELEKEILNLK